MSMAYTNEQYDRVARYLDGETVILSDVEETLVADILADEAALDKAILVERPGTFVATGHRSRTRKLAMLVACEVAAAILLLIGAAILFDHTVDTSIRVNPIQSLTDSDTVALETDLFSDDLESDLAALDQELELLEQDLFADVDDTYTTDFDTWLDTIEN
jgi:hypothetical protein